MYQSDGERLQWFMTDRLSLDSTYRYIWLERVQSKNANLEDKEFDCNGHMVTIGLNLHF